MGRRVAEFYPLANPTPCVCRGTVVTENESNQAGAGQRALRAGGRLRAEPDFHSRDDARTSSLAVSGPRVWSPGAGSVARAAFFCHVFLCDERLNSAERRWGDQTRLADECDQFGGVRHAVRRD